MFSKIKIFSVSALTFLISICSSQTTDSVPQDIEAWGKLPQILAQIRTPEFPDKKYNVLDFGAIGDGKTVCTRAINAAIAKCSSEGGGTVIVPSGNYFTATIHIKSNVNLYIDEKATLLFSQNPDDYLPVVFTRFESVECYNYSPFIYAHKQKNIAISGKGTLDGQADSLHWWPWKGSWKGKNWVNHTTNQRKYVDSLNQMAEDKIAVEKRMFGKGFYLRPNFIQFIGCENVAITDVTIVNSPMWIINPVLCNNVTIQNAKVVSHGPNNDGCDPESCSNVLIKDCYFDTGDDCIAIKSGRNADGRRVNVPAKNIVVQGCTMKDGHGGVVIGSEISGSCFNVFAEDCFMDSPNLDRVLRIKSNSIRGGKIENIYMRNVTAGVVKEAILHVDFYYQEGDAGTFVPQLKNVFMRNVKSSASNMAFYIKAYERAPAENILIQDCNFSGVKGESIIENVKNMQLKDVFINGSQVK